MQIFEAKQVEIMKKLPVKRYIRLALLFYNFCSTKGNVNDFGLINEIILC